MAMIRSAANRIAHSGRAQDHLFFRSVHHRPHCNVGPCHCIGSALGTAPPERDVEWHGAFLDTDLLSVARSGETGITSVGIDID